MAGATQTFYDENINQATTLLTGVERIPDDEYSILKDAIISCSVESVRLCLQKLQKGGLHSSNINGGHHLLNTAIFYSTEDIAMLLIEAGANLIYQDEYGHYLIHNAAVQGFNQVITVLLTNDQSLLELETSLGDTPLEIAVINDRVDTVSLLIEYGAKLMNSMLYVDDVRILHLLVNRFGRDIVNQPFNGDYPLHRIIMFRPSSADLAEELLKMGADPNSKNANGETILHIGNFNIDVLRVLLTHGADNKVTNNDGLTPVELLSQKHRDVRMIDLIRNWEHIPDVKEPDDS